jgi:tRNA threonylcarbamoyladenosine biosynthesis protein TsaE
MTTNGIKITTHCLEETQKLGKKIGLLLEKGAFFALYGDLGSGKTSFVQGLARGLAVPADRYVTSPTFTLINEYQGRLKLFHIDLYRIDDTADMDDLGVDEMINSKSVVAVEWSEKLPKNFISDYLEIKFIMVDDTTRVIGIIPYGLDMKNLIQEATF